MLGTAKVGNKIFLVVLAAGLFLGLNFYLFEGVSVRLLSRFDQTNQKEPRNLLEEWQPIKRELDELMEEKQGRVTRKMDEIAQKEEHQNQEQQQKIDELEEIVRKQTTLLDELSSKAQTTSQPEGTDSSWNVDDLRLENIVLSKGEVRHETPMNIVLKTITNPSFEMVLEVPFHGATDDMLNSTRAFIPMAAMVWNHILSEKCKAKGDLKPVVVDVGANIGYLTGYGQAMGCVMHSFEPFPSAFRVMRSMVKRNPFAYNVFTYPQVVSSGPGFLSVQENEKWVFNKVQAHGNLQIATVALDDVIQRKVLLLKIDVEGHEMSVIRGATKLIEEYAENILIEFKKEGGVKERVEWLNLMIANPKWKVYCFSETYGTREIQQIYKNFKLKKHTNRFVRLSNPVNEEEWIPYEDIWLTSQESPFDF